MLINATASETARTTYCIHIVGPSLPPLQCRLLMKTKLRYSRNDVSDTKYTTLVSGIRPRLYSFICSGRLSAPKIG